MNRSIVIVLSLQFMSFAATAAEPELTGVLKRIKDTGGISVGYADAPFPFSYFDSTRNIVGYSIDVCKKVIDAVKAEVKKPGLKVDMRPVKADDAVSYVVSGVIDIHCGPVLNNWARKGRVEFGPTYFVRQYRFASHESAHMDGVLDMENRTYVVPSGSPAVDALQGLGMARGWKFTVVPAMNNEDAFRIFREGGADAIVLDEISLAEGVAKTLNLDPALVMLSGGAWGAEPFSLVYVKGDAPFKKLVAGTMHQLFTSGSIRPVYDKWFVNTIPGAKISMNLPVSEPLEKAFAKPTDSPGPALYQ